MNEKQWRLFCIIFLGSLCAAMVWAELSRASTAPVRTHWRVFRHQMIHEDLGQEDPVFPRPLGREQDIRVLGGALVDRIFFMRAPVPQLKVSNRTVSEFLMNDPSTDLMPVRRLNEIVPGIMRDSPSMETRPRLMSEYVDAVGSVEEPLVQTGAMEQVLESVGKDDVGVEVQDPVEPLEVPEAKVDTATLVERGPIRMHLRRLNTVNAVAVTDGLGFFVVRVAHDDDMVKVGKVFRQAMGQKVRIVLTNNHGFKFHGEVL